MTGYGRGEAAGDGFKVIVELSSVNRKQGEVHLSLPRELETLEARVRDAIHQRVARGRLSARIMLQTRRTELAGAGPPERTPGPGLCRRTRPSSPNL